MEIAVIWFLSMMALNEQIVSQGEQIVVLEKSIDDIEDHVEVIENGFVKLSTHHSAFYAGQQIKNDRVEASLEALKNITKDLGDHTHVGN